MFKLPLSGNTRRGLLRIWIVLSVVWVIGVGVAMGEQVLEDAVLLATPPPPLKDAHGRMSNARFTYLLKAYLARQRLFDAATLMFAPPIAVLILTITGAYAVSWINTGFKGE